MPRKPTVLYLAAATLALTIGLLVYLLDRQPQHTYFLSHVFTPDRAPYALFGVAGNYLPAFLHVYAFVLLTVAIAGSANAQLVRIGAAWFIIATLFEFGQHPALSPFLAAALPAWFAYVPVLDNSASYFLNGTFDVLDILSIALGTVAACLTVIVGHEVVRTTLEKGQNRILRRGAIAGVTTLGLLAIIASGGGESTPDTTPPSIIATNPANGATGFFIDGSIRITFSEPMDLATIKPTTVKLENTSNSMPVTLLLFYDGDVVTITLASPLAPSTNYTATVTSDVKDLAGNALTAAHSWSFTTETDAWQPSDLTDAPAGRIKHTAVWTGSEMIVWGGQNSVGFINTGGLYDPVANTWSTTTNSNAPSPRLGHTAIWDNLNNKMIVWGGVDGLPNYFNDGKAYDPANDVWSLIKSPSSIGFLGRRDHTAVWTGTEMIVWGGYTSNLEFSNTGAAYNPAADEWSLLPPSALLGRVEHTAVWTGTEMIVMGGRDGSNYFNNGAAYDPVTNTWQPIADPPAGFFGRSNHTAVWTGMEIIVWGGTTNTDVTNTGAAYNPTTDTWRIISTAGAPTPRLDHTAVWTGSVGMGVTMVVWGGQDGASNSFNNGGRYDPVTDSWRTTDDLTSNPTSNVPTDRYDHTAVWTGTTMIVWGGNDGTFTNTGGRYAP